MTSNRPLLFASSVMAQITKLASLGAKSEVPVLITGETGTGKDLLAEFIHQASGREKPFVPIDCGSLSEQLLESELFGHVRGSFTGALKDKPGLLQVADGGSAFFDEIGELPLSLQAKLLRVLQTHEVRRVGALSPTQSKFRVISATNRDLPSEVRAGRFREDLYYRLAVIRLHVPPLRERPEDIPLLVHHFAGRYGVGVSEQILETLVSLHWPGNVRQLENCIACLAALHDCPALQSGHRCESLGPILTSAESMCARGEQPAGWSLKYYERLAISKALERTHGHLGKAAELLGIGRTTLYRKVRTFKIAFSDQQCPVHV